MLVNSTEKIKILDLGLGFQSMCLIMQNRVVFVLLCLRYLCRNIPRASREVLDERDVLTCM